MSAPTPNLQLTYDDAMFDYSREEYATALARLQTILAEDPDHFDARLAAAMCLYRQGDYAAAIVEGHKAERLRPNEQLVHTNLSLFYMKSGDKTTAEKHGLQARIASWKENMAPPPASGVETPLGESELQMAQPKATAFKTPEKFPDMPWKKKAPTKPATQPGAMDSKPDSPTSTP